MGLAIGRMLALPNRVAMSKRSSAQVTQPKVIQRYGEKSCFLKIVPAIITCAIFTVHLYELYFDLGNETVDVIMLKLG